MKEYTVYIVEDGEGFRRHYEDGTKGLPYTTDGNKTLEIWCKLGTKILHREDGPALYFKYKFKPTIEFYVLDGEEMRRFEWEAEVAKRNAPPVKELTVEEISKLLGYEIKVVK